MTKIYTRPTHGRGAGDLPGGDQAAGKIVPESQASTDSSQITQPGPMRELPRCWLLHPSSR